MRQMLVVGEVLSGYGRWILVGLRRLVSAMCFLVVRFSQMGGESLVSSSSSSPSAMRVCFPAGTEFAEVLICARRALEAFNVCRLLEGSAIRELIY